MNALLSPVLLAITLAAVVSQAGAWNEPDSVLGIKWGTRFSEVKAKNKNWNCSESSILGLNCEGWVDMGVRAWASIDFSPKKEMDGVNLKVSLSRYGELRRIIMEKYGPPTSVDKIAQETNFGSTFLVERIYWVGKRVHVILRERFPEPNEAMVHIKLDSRVEREKAAREEWSKKRKRGL